MTPQCPTVSAGTDRPPEPGRALIAGRITSIIMARSLWLPRSHGSERTSALTGSASPAAIAGGRTQGCEARACSSSEWTSIAPRLVARARVCALSQAQDRQGMHEFDETRKFEGIGSQQSASKRSNKHGQERWN